MRYLVSGEKGFLLSHCLDELEGEIIHYDFGKQYYNIDTVIHFASPNDKYEFENKSNMAFSMVNYSISILKQSIYNDAKFIFASSEAAEHPDNDYGIYKLFFERYIQGLTDNHLIYRIPRVYGEKRTKGLMKQLRMNEVDINDYENEIEYIDIEVFKKWFLSNIDEYGTLQYTGDYSKNTISQIKERYIK